MNNLVLSLAPKFTKLQVLNLRQDTPQLLDAAVEMMSNYCHDLQDLDLSKSFKLTDYPLYALARGCLNLIRLNISGCSAFNDNPVAYLANLCGCVRAIFQLCHELLPGHLPPQAIKDLQVPGRIRRLQLPVHRVPRLQAWIRSLQVYRSEDPYGPLPASDSSGDFWIGPPPQSSSSSGRQSPTSSSSDSIASVRSRTLLALLFLTPRHCNLVASVTVSHLTSLLHVVPRTPSGSSSSSNDFVMSCTSSSDNYLWGRMMIMLTPREQLNQISNCT